MPKNPNRHSKLVKKDESLSSVMKFFLAGCVAEAYILIVRRLYIGGVSRVQINWYDLYLPVLIGIGAAILVVGGILSYLWRADEKKREIGWYALGGGAFLALSSLLIRLLNAPMVTLLSVVIPVVVLLDILWNLYDRECAISLTILGVSLIALWIFRKSVTSISYGMFMKVLAVIYLALLAGVVVMVRKADQNNGKIGKVQALAANTDLLPVYVACGLSAVGIVTVLINTTIAYYAMWALAIVVFALAVYYTVKQL